MAKFLLNFFSTTSLKEKVLDNKNCWQLFKRAFLALTIFIYVTFYIQLFSLNYVRFQSSYAIISYATSILIIISIPVFLTIAKVVKHVTASVRSFRSQELFKHLSYPWSPTFYLVDCAICIVWRVTSETFLN